MDESTSGAFVVLGRDMGAIGGWDNLDTADFMFYAVQLNELGQQFLPDFEQGRDIAINFQSGEVMSYAAARYDDPRDEIEDPSDNGNPIRHKPNWAVFNA